MPPEYEDIEKITLAQRNHKSPGTDGIHSAFVIHRGNFVEDWDIWQNERKPGEWSEASLSAIYKKNSRGLLLLSEMNIILIDT